MAALSYSGGAYRDGSLARYDPFGNYRTTPATNPTVTDRGYTGHVHDNTAANAL